MKKLQELVKRVKIMEGEMIKINALMDEIDDINEIIGEAYPFHHSFEEMVLEVGEWVDKIEWNVDMELEEKQIEIIDTIINIGYGLGLDLEESDNNVAKNLIFDGYLSQNYNATRMEIRNAILNWLKDTKENYPEILDQYLF